MAGVALVAVAVAVFVVVQNHQSGRRSVLVVSRDVPAGAVLTAADLRSARVTVGGGVDVEPASALPVVVGKVAGVPLSAGSLLPAAAVGTARATPAGQAQVGVAVAAGAYPPDLAAGDHVLAVLTTGTGAASGGPASTATDSTATGGGAAATVSGTVLMVRPAATGDTGAVVVVQVAEPDAPTVAVAAAGGRVSLVRQAAGG